MVMLRIGSRIQLQESYGTNRRLKLAEKQNQKNPEQNKRWGGQRTSKKKPGMLS